jgi:hypothetical protein
MIRRFKVKVMNFSNSSQRLVKELESEDPEEEVADAGPSNAKRARNA